MSRQKEQVDSIIAEAIIGEPIPHHRADWHFRDKRNRERCDLLGYECPLVHFEVEADQRGEDAEKEE